MTCLTLLHRVAAKCYRVVPVGNLQFPASFTASTFCIHVLLLPIVQIYMYTSFICMYIIHTVICNYYPSAENGNTLFPILLFRLYTHSQMHHQCVSCIFQRLNNARQAKLDIPRLQSSSFTHFSLSLFSIWAFYDGFALQYHQMPRCTQFLTMLVRNFKTTRKFFFQT